MVMTKFGFILAETTGETPAETPDMMVRIQEFIKSPYFYAALAVLVILVLIALSSSSNRKKVIKQNEDNQFRLNNLKSVPLPFDISRAMAMARVNKEIDATVKENQGKFDLVQTNLKTLQGMIADSDEYVQLRKYGMARDNNNRIDKLLTETEKTVEDLENSLSTILEQENVPARVLDFPDGLDPDEFIRRDGAEGFRNLPAISPAVYRLRRLKEQFDLSAQDGRLAYARGASEIVSAVDPLERDVLLSQLSLETGFSRETLTEQMKLSVRKDAVRTSETVARPRPSVRTVTGEAVSDDIKAQELLLSLFASGKIPKDMIEEKDFDDDELKSLYRELAAGASPASLPDLAPDEASRSRYVRLLLTPTAGSTDEMISMATDCLARIRRSKLEKRYEELSQEISAASGEQLSAFLREAQEISDKLKKLK